MVLGGILGLLLIVPAWLMAIAGRDAWPFSSYPMFSHLQKPEDLKVLRIAFESFDGRLSWWRPHFHKLQPSVASDLRPRLGTDARAQRQRAVGIIYRSLKFDGQIPRAGYIALVSRHCERTSSGGWRIVDRVVSRMKLGDVAGLH
jgi:hypothetical protein